MSEFSETVGTGLDYHMNSSLHSIYSDKQYQSQVIPSNLNLKLNLAKTKYEKYSSVKARKESLSNLSNRNKQLPGTSTAGYFIDVNEKREKMIREMYKQIRMFGAEPANVLDDDYTFDGTDSNNLGPYPLSNN